jgi:hypothetical protein
MALFYWVRELPSAELMPKHYTTKNWSSRKVPPLPYSSPSSGRPHTFYAASFKMTFFLPVPNASSLELLGDFCLVKSAT